MHRSALSGSEASQGRLRGSCCRLRVIGNVACSSRLSGISPLLQPITDGPTPTQLWPTNMHSLAVPDDAGPYKVGAFLRGNNVSALLLRRCAGRPLDRRPFDFSAHWG